MTPLKASRELRGSRTLAKPQSYAVQRAGSYGAARQTGQIQVMQTYGTPNAEVSLTRFQELAQNAYGGGGFTGNSVIFALIDRRASLFSEATFKFRDLATKRLFGTADLAKLEHPWPGGDTGDLLTRMEQDVSLAGNAFIRDTGDGLERLRPDWVTIVSEVTGIAGDTFGQVRRVVGYFYDPVNDTDREPDYYPVAEVAHWAPTPDPLANFRGMSWMTPVIREITGDIRMSEYREAFFRNAATPNIVIRYSQKMAPERVERLRTAIQARHTGPDGAFGTMVLDEGADLTVVGADLGKIGFADVQAAAENRIAAASGVPAIVAGLREGLQTVQIGMYSEAVRAFADLKIRPNWRSACAALEKLVNVPPNAQLWYDASDVSALQAGEQDRSNAAWLQTRAITALVMQGFEPDSVVKAVTSGDFSLLVHTGLVSVQVQPGAQPPSPVANQPTPTA